MVTYIMVDDEGYVNAWSSNPQEGFIKVNNTTQEFRQDFMLYRVTDDGLVRDETRVLEGIKEGLREEVSAYAQEGASVSFESNGSTYVFKVNRDNKGFLSKSRELMSAGVMDETHITCKTLQDDLAVVTLTNEEVEELWVRTFMKENKMNAMLQEALAYIKGIDTVAKANEYAERLEVIEWDKLTGTENHSAE